jgi:FkbM family methyltransferase
MLASDEIIWGYRYVLGREPQPEEISHLVLDPVARSQLRERLLGSDEFAAKQTVIGHVPKWVITEIFEGKMEIRIDLADKYVSYGCLIDNYEPQETVAFRRLLRPGYHVADIGANVGWFTFLAAQFIGPEGRVTAVEPRVPTVDYLRRSVRLNQLDNRIIVVQNAVGNRSGTVSLTWHPASHNPGHSYVGEPGENDEGQLVEMLELDTLLGEAKIDCIKMDIEGAEGLALIGAGTILQVNRPFILCEINPAALRAVSDIAVEEFLCLVCAKCYIPLSLEDCGDLARLEGSPEFEDNEVINIVLAHQERLPDSVRLS